MVGTQAAKIGKDVPVGPVTLGIVEGQTPTQGSCAGNALGALVPEEMVKLSSSVAIGHDHVSGIAVGVSLIQGEFVNSANDRGSPAYVTFIKRDEVL
ncbi:hypothetical protein LTR53_003258 [Teratosphaeriaceae sp. CCFEE 6253]|nr:hypothetical protein LTR53_003258 [Teratosphaeriaceae sp. CCFEE 6253]